MDGIATLDEAKIARLQELHPQAEPTPQEMVPVPNMEAYTIETLSAVINKLPSDSSPGPSGWSYALLKAITRKVPLHHPIWAGIFRICLQIVENRCPLRDWMLASRLIGLEKPNGDIRPIAMGESITKIASLWALRANESAIPHALLRSQFGVGSPGGVEPVILALTSAWMDPDQDFGVGELDFVNAFNTVSRSKIAEQLKNRIPSLVPIFQFLYCGTSALLVHLDGVIHPLVSSTGVRQGDPLAPLLFSLAIRPLLEKLEAHMGDDMKGHSSYLDDVFPLLRDQSAFDKALEFLNQREIAVEFGLVPNLQKSWFRTVDHLRLQGTKILGTHCGGPPDSSNEGCKAVLAATDTLRDRLRSLDLLTKQEQLILLRLCFAPRLNHLIRTLPPDVVLEGCQRFDAVLMGAIGKIVGHEMTPRAMALAQLPIRMGGLGVFSQATLSPFAYGASFVLSQRVLRSRGYVISDATSRVYEPFVKLCESNLMLPADTVVVDLEVEEMKNLQRRASEAMHEQAWSALFDSMSLTEQVQFVELGSCLARPWLHVIPSDNRFVLKDEAVEYGLCRHLLLPTKTDPVAPTVCRWCNKTAHPRHYLTCRASQSYFTYRHNQVREILARTLKQAQFHVLQEQSEIARQAPRPTERRHDLVVRQHLNATHRTVYDVGITCIKTNPAQLVQTVQWPSVDQVQTEASIERQHRADFFWEDHSDEPATKEVRLGQARRRLCLAAALHPVINKMEGEKTRVWTRDYPGVDDDGDDFHPLIFTAGGGTSHTVDDLLRTCLARVPDFRDKVKFRKYVRGHLSVTLLRFSSYMASRAMYHGDARAATPLRVPA